MGSPCQGSNKKRGTGLMRNAQRDRHMVDDNGDTQRELHGNNAAQRQRTAASAGAPQAPRGQHCARSDQIGQAAVHELHGDGIGDQVAGAVQDAGRHKAAQHQRPRV